MMNTLEGIQNNSWFEDLLKIIWFVNFHIDPINILICCVCGQSETPAGNNYRTMVPTFVDSLLDKQTQTETKL